MPEQILSQEEIDALLSAMDSGEVEVEQEKAPKAKVEARPYDLTSQSLMLRDQFDALDEVYDKFVNLLNVGLTSALQRAIEVKQVSKEIVKFGEFLHAFSNPTGFSIYTMEPLIGASLLAVEPNLCFALIDCMFGGAGRPLPKVREFTQIEQRMLSKLYSDVLVELERAWQVAYNIKVMQKKTETKPEFVNLVSPADLVLIFVFSVAGEEFSGNIHVCTPFLMLEPVKDKLSSRYLREKDRAHAFRAQLTVLLRDTKVKMVAELGKTVSTIGQILNLEKDDIVKINTGPQDPVIIKVEGTAKYLGMPGTLKGNRAVRISGLIRKDEGV
ncbi:MAG: flagellar motor switch protein FliM [Desulfobacteraceae bacterium]|nr:MAG: flagellar motor switch protein FliM [Desulfobacteraceae bacterium]